MDDPPVRVVAGSTVTLAPLANDTDDGLGRPAGETPHLEVAAFTALGARVSTGPHRTRLRFTARPDDAGRSFALSYTATDGSLESEPASAQVTVSVPPVLHRVTLHVPPLVVLRPSLLRGSVRPLGPATVRVQRLVGTRWTAFRSDRADARGRYAVRFRTDRPQRLTLRAVATWNDDRRAVSGRLTRTVVARPDVRVSGPLTRADVPHSYRAGCPVRPSGLRRISVNRFTYRRVVARGSLVVRASAVPDLVRVFRASFLSRFPVRTMMPSDAFYAGGRRTPTQSDLAAMRADNTSAFNCRPVTGNPYRISQHSYGNAIDINTVRNPYVVGGRVFPAFARTYLDRSRERTGMILRDGVIATSMRRNGWPWGARWSHPDYQHFSANGG
ncbi:MAG TPA: M15 family metallopeptidase [Nocardioidaceae bacterium]|nr:M15 family metallopeptidase [Nocardioidaceae bacterium]